MGNKLRNKKQKKQKIIITWTIVQQSIQAPGRKTKWEKKELQKCVGFAMCELFPHTETKKQKQTSFQSNLFFPIQNE